MSAPAHFAARITRAPRAFDPDRGRDAAAPFGDLPPEMRGVLEGTAGCSPYLAGLMGREADWLTEALSGPPEAAMDALIARIGADDEKELGVELRRAKGRVALLVALADLGGVWPLEDVTGALTRFADRAVDAAIRVLVAREIARGKLSGLAAGDAETGGGMAAIAMGKMGAAELNYSSDIDLVCLFDETRFDSGDVMEARAAFIRVTRQMAALLSDVTEDGYVFRTDLRLRPDPAVTPVCLSMDAAERYYESVGRTWERAAYIKARTCGGDIVAGEAFLTRLTPFVFRRHLDYAAIRDAHDMRLRIREHKALGRALRLDGHNLKLGSGGIREIEFYTQTRQIIAGGRDPRLRIRGTVPALGALKEAGWAEEADGLIADYRAHREIEHRLQMIADQQTHNLPASDEGWARLAAFADTDAADLRAALRARLERVAEITEGFFQPAAAKPAPEMSPAAAEIVARWPSYPALRSARAVEIFHRVQPELLSRLARARNPDEALRRIDGFLAGLPAGVQLFAMFEANPHLIDLIVDIAATSPALAGYLSRHSAVFDAVIGGGFFTDWPGADPLTSEFAQALARARDYEARLLTARRLRNEWHFRIGVHFLRGLVDATTAGAQYADLAQAVLAALWDPVVADFAEKHGPPPGRGAVVLGMGSLGAGALTATSDLDLIVIYDPAGAEASEGRRPLPARTYYARLTQAFVTAVTAQMGPGRLYEVDMRLRPSGRQGPVATSLEGFRGYQTNEAWTWEHLALTHARPVAGSAALGDEVEAFRRDLLAKPRAAPAILADLGDMRARLQAAERGSGGWDLKDGPGQLKDIALLAEAGALLAGSPARDVPGQLGAAQGALGLDDDAAGALTDAHRLMRAAQAAMRLIGPGFDPAAAGEGARALLLRETGAANMAALEAELSRSAARVAEIADALAPARREAMDDD